MLQPSGEKPIGKSPGSLAPVQLQGIAVEVLQALPRPLDRNALVFPNLVGDVWRLQYFRGGFWDKVLKNAGLAHRGPKQTRHTFATLSLTAGAPLEWISKQLRHSNMEITRKHYARWLPAADTRWLAMLDAFAAEEMDGNRTAGNADTFESDGTGTRPAA